MNAQVRATLAAAVATAACSTALATSFQTNRWLNNVLVAVGVVAGVGILMRLRPGVSVLLQPLVAAAALAVTVTLLFGNGTGMFGLIPSSETLTVLSAQMERGFLDIQELAAPVPAKRGLMLITLLGVGAVAIVVDFIAVALRRPAVAGLPLLALFVVPAAVVPEGVGWLPFALGAVGYLVLLLSEGRERLGRWGVPVRERTSGGAGSAAFASAQGADAAPLARVARRIGAAAVSVAVVVPALVPGLAGGFLRGSGTGTGEGDGSSRSITTYNPLVRLKGELTLPTPRPLLRVATDDQEPGYLRMTVLDRFTGQAWSQSQLDATPDERVREGMPAPQGLSLADTTEIRAQITAQDLVVPWLPVPYPAREVEVEGDWRVDRESETIFSTRTDTRGLSYDVTSAKVLATAEQLQAADAEPDEKLLPYLELPPELPGEIRLITAEVITGARTPYERVLAIQEYLRSDEFRYSLRTEPGNSGSDLLDFLRNKAGYCEQFAAAMGVMVRIAGVPSRVAVGFTRGDRVAAGTYQVTTDAAHAWPEVYFPGAGWLPFEPTPRTDGQAVRADYAVPGSLDDDAPSTSAPLPTTSASAAPAPSGGSREEIDDRLAGEDAAVNGAGSGGGRAAVVVPAVGLGLLALLAAPMLIDRGVRRRRWRSSGSPEEVAAAAWQQLQDDAADIGYTWQDTDSPRTAATRLVRDRSLDSVAAASVQRIAQALERALYASSAASPDGLTDDVREVRGALLEGVPRSTRWRAQLLRPSALRRGGHAVAGKVADVLDRFDSGADAVSRAVTSRFTRSRTAE